MWLKPSKLSALFAVFSKRKRKVDFCFPNQFSRFAQASWETELRKNRNFNPSGLGMQTKKAERKKLFRKHKEKSNEMGKKVAENQKLHSSAK